MHLDGVVNVVSLFRSILTELSGKSTFAVPVLRLTSTINYSRLVPRVALVVSVRLATVGDELRTC